MGEDAFGAVFKVDSHDNAQSIGYVLYRSDEKDPGPDQALEFGPWGYEVWQLQGVDPNSPYLELQLPVTKAIVYDQNRFDIVFQLTILQAQSIQLKH